MEVTHHCAGREQKDQVFEFSVKKGQNKTSAMRLCVLCDCFELHIYLFEWPIVTLGVMHVIQTGHMCPWLHDCTYSGVSGVGYHFVNRIFLLLHKLSF